MLDLDPAQVVVSKEVAAGRRGRELHDAPPTQHGHAPQRGIDLEELPHLALEAPSHAVTLTAEGRALSAEIVEDSVREGEVD